MGQGGARRLGGCWGCHHPLVVRQCAVCTQQTGRRALLWLAPLSERDAACIGPACGNPPRPPPRRRGMVRWLRLRITCGLVYDQHVGASLGRRAAQRRLITGDRVAGAGSGGQWREAGLLLQAGLQPRVRAASACTLLGGIRQVGCIGQPSFSVQLRGVHCRGQAGAAWQSGGWWGLPTSATTHAPQAPLLRVQAAAGDAVPLWQALGLAGGACGAACFCGCCLGWLAGTHPLAALRRVSAAALHQQRAAHAHEAACQRRDHDPAGGPGDAALGAGGAGCGRRLLQQRPERIRRRELPHGGFDGPTNASPPPGCWSRVPPAHPALPGRRCLCGCGLGARPSFDSQRPCGAWGRWGVPACGSGRAVQFLPASRPRQTGRKGGTGCRAAAAWRSTPPKSPARGCCDHFSSHTFTGRRERRQSSAAAAPDWLLDQRARRPALACASAHSIPAGRLWACGGTLCLRHAAVGAQAGQTSSWSRRSNRHGPATQPAQPHRGMPGGAGVRGP
jgi:hypothetical protein